MEHLTARMGAATLSSEPPQPKHSNLYVSGLGAILQTEQDLIELFSQYGRVETCRLVRNSKETKSFAFVKFASIPESLEAIAALNHKTVGGSVLEVKTADAGDPGRCSRVTARLRARNGFINMIAHLSLAHSMVNAAGVIPADAGDRNPELLAPPSDNLYAKVRAGGVPILVKAI